MRRAILRGLRLVHLGGLTILLGSISTFILISALMEGTNLENIGFGRKIISAGTNILTLPAIWVLAASGIAMSCGRHNLRQRFCRIKLLLITIVMVNGYVFVVPAITSATSLAAQSLAQGQLLPAYKSAYVQESVVGSLNVALIIAAAVIGVWRTGDVESKE